MRPDLLAAAGGLAQRELRGIDVRISWIERRAGWWRSAVQLAEIPVECFEVGHFRAGRAGAMTARWEQGSVVSIVVEDAVAKGATAGCKGQKPRIRVRGPGG